MVLVLEDQAASHQTFCFQKQLDEYESQINSLKKQLHDYESQIDILQKQLVEYSFQKQQVEYELQIDKDLDYLLKDHEQKRNEDIKSIFPNAIDKELRKELNRKEYINIKSIFPNATDKELRKKLEEKCRIYSKLSFENLVPHLFKNGLEIPKMFTNEEELEKFFWDLFKEAGRKPYSLKDPDDELKDDLKGKLDDMMEVFRQVYPKDKTMSLINTDRLEIIYDKLVHEYVQCMFL